MLLACVALWLGGAFGCRSSSSTPKRDGWCGAIGASAPSLRSLGTRRRLALGAVADTRGAAPSTVATLRQFAATCREHKVDAVVVLGDIGRSEDDIVAVLSAVGDAGVPVLALAGELEGAAAFRAAVARARAAGVDVIDMVETRRLDTGAMDIVAVPGAPDGDECRYTPQDLAALATIAGRRWRPLVLLAHTPPRDQGANGVDWSDGRNVGDAALLDLINAVYPNVALFAHADDAGGRVRRTWMNVGGASRGTASIVELVDGLPHIQLVR